MKTLLLILISSLLFTSSAFSIEMTVSSYYSEQENWNKKSPSEKDKFIESRKIFNTYLLGMYEGFILMNETIAQEDAYCTVSLNLITPEMIYGIIENELDSDRVKEIPYDVLINLPIGLILLSGINSDTSCERIDNTSSK